MQAEQFSFFVCQPRQKRDREVRKGKGETIFYAVENVIYLLDMKMVLLLVGGTAVIVCPFHFP